MGVTVSRLALTPVKGTRLQTVPEVELDRGGAGGDREFFVVDDEGRMVNGKRLGALTSVMSERRDGVLRLEFPDGRVVEDRVVAGPSVSFRFHSRSREGGLVEGLFSAALSEHAGQPLRLVLADGSGVDRGRRGAVSLISGASLARLAEAGELARLDARRFRMLIEVAGVAAHEEDRWIGRSCQVGEARIRWLGHVGRCLITSRDPDSGEIDLPTLEMIGSYRRGAQTTEPLAFGVYGEVLTPGRVRVGDELSLVDGTPAGPRAQ